MTVSTRHLGGGVPEDNFRVRTMDMSLSDDKILEKGAQGILALRDMFLSDDTILKRGTQLWGYVPN